MSRPAYMDKFPCESCGTGYIDCAQWWAHDRQCCADCKHPPREFTDDEIEEMWQRAGKERPAWTKKTVRSSGAASVAVPRGGTSE